MDTFAESDIFTFDDMKQIKRAVLGDQVPLELFRAIRLIGMYQGLPMHGQSTTSAVGRKIGESMPVASVDECFRMFQELKIGIPSIIREDKRGMRVAVDDCFCEGLPVNEGKMVCDLEGAIMEGALTKVLGKRATVKEVKCNVNGDDRCEYELRVY